jgi:hypothetical protein
LVGKAPNVVTISHRHDHSISSFSGAAQKVAILQMLHLFIRFMSQNSQSFSCNLSHAFLERPPRCGSLDHLVNAADMIGHRPPIDDHTHMPKVQVPMKQPRGADEKWGLAISQRQEQCPQSPQEVASTLTITMGLRRHIIPTRRCTDVLPRCQLPCHLEKEKKTRVNNH